MSDNSSQNLLTPWVEDIFMESLLMFSEKCLLLKENQWIKIS